MNDPRSIRGKRALVTGAASGIGRATAALFAAEGASVAATDVALDGLEHLVDEVRSAGGDIRPWQMNVADDASVRRVVEQIAASLGGIDIVVNCAGVSIAAEFGDDGAWQKTLEVNLNGTMRTLREALPHLEKSGAGRVVNIASTEALGATPLLSPYTASKHAVIGLTRALAVEVALKGITVNAICPGPIRTGMTAPIPEENKQRWARRKVPLKRYGEPVEVAHAILSLVLPAASYITGAHLLVDGGMTALS
jgi:3-oxoacyl-[acyl-carrier protein] reductase